MNTKTLSLLAAVFALLSTQKSFAITDEQLEMRELARRITHCAQLARAYTQETKVQIINDSSPSNDALADFSEDLVVCRADSDTQRAVILGSKSEIEKK
jgi:hypothetical protein